jgi:outer membrane lipoprotein carrier protein
MVAETLLVTLLTLPLAQPAPAKAPVKPEGTSPEVAQLVSRVQAFYDATSDFTARFTQQYTYKAFKRKQTSTGQVVFKRPGLMRWEYEAPSPRTFVLAGEKVYAHDPEAMTLTKGSISSDQLSASVTFLLGKGKLLEEFTIRKSACEKCEGVLLELSPVRPDPRYKALRLEVDPKSAQVLASTVVDPDGSENRISFQGLRANVGVDKERFRLTPPEGTQVVDLTRSEK